MGSNAYSLVKGFVVGGRQSVGTGLTLARFQSGPRQAGAWNRRVAWLANLNPFKLDYRISKNLIGVALVGCL